MGRLLLIWRLAARDLRRHPAQAALLVVVIAAAMTALTLGLVLHGVTAKPYTQTKAQTAGPDVVASSVGYGAIRHPRWWTSRRSSREPGCATAASSWSAPSPTRSASTSATP